MVTSTNSPEISPNQLFATVEGVILPSAAGTVQLMAGSETGGSTIVIVAGSHLELTELP